MEHPDEGTIHAWLDDALSTEESAVIAAHVAECGDCAASVAEARGFIAASSRIVTALDDVPRGVLPRREAIAPAPMLPAAGRNGSRAAARRWWARPRLAAAALLVVVAGSVYSVRGRDASLQNAVYESADSALSGPALAPSAAASSSAPSPDAVRVRASVPPNELLAPQRTAARGAVASGVGVATATPRALGERTDARREARKLEATTSAPMSAPAVSPAPVATAPVTASSALAVGAPSPQLRKTTANDAAGAVAASAPLPPSAATRRAPGAVTTTGQAFARAMPLTPGCYTTSTAGMPQRVVLTDSIVATVSARTWYRARPWPASTQNPATEWRWAPLETSAAELLSIVRGDTTSYRVSTAARDASGCR